MEGSGSTGGGDSPRGLNVGKKVFYGKLGGGGGGDSSSVAEQRSAAAGKKGKSPAQGALPPPPPPRCQVEGCGLDLTGSKAYYCRHKVCATHSKTPKVVVAGKEQRFCQQCSRFHQLCEFDQGKRSCRRRLAGHNERRRKPVLTAVGRCPAPPLPPPFEGGGGFLMNFSHPRLPATQGEVWPSIRAQGGLPVAPWMGGAAWHHGGAATNLGHPYIQGLPDGTLFPRQETSHPGEGLRVSDSDCALSLLSTQPWGSAAVRNPSPEGPGSSYGAAAGFADDPWSLKGHPDVTSGGTSATSDDGKFSGELELALQGDKASPDSGLGRGYGYPGGHLPWLP